MRIIVCGGRDLSDPYCVNFALILLHKNRPITYIAQGGAPGADMLAKDWAKRHRVTFATYQADWRRGRKAGPERNQLMLDTERLFGLDAVVAFPGGRGTADMVRRATRAGVRVWQPYRT